MLIAEDLKQTTDILAVIGADVSLRRTSSTSGGEHHGPCPFCGGRDRFCVWPESGRWWCRQCDRKGDVIGYVMEREGFTFAGACEYLGGPGAATLRAERAPAVRKRESERAEPSSVWKTEAAVVVEACRANLWAPEGEKARAWLRERGLKDETSKRWNLGFCPADCVIGELWVPRGILIPWFVDGELWAVRVRRATGEKYKLITWGKHSKHHGTTGGITLLFGAETLIGKNEAFFCEGEFDAMLLHQEGGELVGIVTLGSASNPLRTRALQHLLPVSRFLLCYDVDANGAGDKGARKLMALSSRMKRVKVPAGKDVTDFLKAGGNLLEWIWSHTERRAPVSSGEESARECPRIGKTDTERHPSIPEAVEAHAEDSERREGPCFCCSGRSFWLNLSGDPVCRECHPPASAGVVMGEFYAKEQRQ